MENKKISLNKLINKILISTTFVVIPIIFLIITLLYFITVSSFSKFLENRLVQTETKKNSELLSKEAQIIGMEFNEIENIFAFLQDEHIQFLSGVDLLSQTLDENLSLNELVNSNLIFKGKLKNLMPNLIEEKLILSRQNSEGSSLVYFLDKQNNSKKYLKAILSESLDPFYKQVVNSNPLVSRIYLSTNDNMIRLYPRVENLTSKLQTNNVSDNLDFDINKLKKAVWTTTYQDIIEKQLIISYISPLYVNSKFEAIVGIDITIEDIKSLLLNNNNRSNKNMFILDQTGSILAMGEETEKLFSNLQNYKSEINTHIDKIYAENHFFSQFTINEKTYLFTLVDVPSLNWKLINIIDEEKLLQPISERKNRFAKIGMITFLGIISLYIILLLKLIQKSKRLSTLVTEPIKRLSYQTKNFGNNITEKDLINSDIREIDRLNRNFLELAKELDIRTEELVQSELEKSEKIREAELYYLTSITDPLTELYNRLKIEEILEYEINQSDRYKHPLSIIFLDIDNFKMINDTMGHDKGDVVLVNLAELLRSNLRDSDSVGRWGGEEFIIVCTNTSLKNAAILAEKLRRAIENHNFSTEQTQTASFGIAEYESGDDRRNLIAKADSAMYEAKRTSKNVVMLYYDGINGKNI